MSVVGATKVFVKPNDPNSGAYGVRTLRTLRAEKSGSARLQKKVEVTYNYFLEEVDPIVGDLITHLLCEQPIDVPGAMLQHLQKQKLDAIKVQKRKESKATDAEKAEEEVAERAAVQEELDKDLAIKAKRQEKKPKKESKLYLALSIGPVVSKLVNRIASIRPKKVVDFMVDELSTMIYGGDEEPKEIETDERFERYAGQNGPRMEEVQREMDRAASIPTETPETQNAASENQEAPEGTVHEEEKQQERAVLQATIVDTKEVVVEKTAPASPAKTIRNLQFAVIGMDGSGKTSLINMLQGRTGVTTKPTIGFKPTTMMLGEELQIRLYDIGGGPKIRDIWPQYYHDVHGVIYVIDASEGDAGREGESVKIMKDALAHSFISGKPLLVLGNKLDAAAGSEAEVIQGIVDKFATATYDTVKVVGCSGVAAEGTEGDEPYLDTRMESGLEWLIETVQGKFDSLQQRVEVDMAIKAKEDAKRRLARERKVLHNKICIAFANEVSDEFKPDFGNKPPNPEDQFTEQEGLNFLIAELGVESTADLSAHALEICAMVGYQRLALQIVGSLKVPISKKKDPMSWEEIHALVVDIRTEVGLMQKDFVDVSSEIKISEA